MDEPRKFCRNCGTKLEEGCCPKCQKQMSPAPTQDEGQPWPSDGVKRHVTIYRNWDVCYKKPWKINVEINGGLEGSLYCDEKFEFETDREYIDMSAYLFHEKEAAQPVRIHLKEQTFLTVSKENSSPTCIVAKVDAFPFPDVRERQKKFAIQVVKQMEANRTLMIIGAFLAIFFLVSFLAMHDWSKHDSKGKDTTTPNTSSTYRGY